MTATAIEGVVAAGRVPTWIIPAATITADPVTGTWSIPLTALTGATTVKIDCHMDFGDMSMNVTPNTRERQRMCQKVKETIVVSEKLRNWIISSPSTIASIIGMPTAIDCWARAFSSAALASRTSMASRRIRAT